MTVLNHLTRPGRAERHAPKNAQQPTILGLTGDLDTQSAGELRTVLRSVAQVPLVILDLSDVGFIDSAGLGVLIGGIRDLHEHGGRAVLVTAPGPTLDLLNRVGVSCLVPVLSALDDATAHLTRDEDETKVPVSARTRSGHS